MIYFRLRKLVQKAYFQAMAQELDGFHCHPIDANTCICALPWWSIHEQRYIVVGMPASQIFGIPTSQIETE